MADGSLLVGDGGRVRRIRRDGRIVTVARVRGCALAALPNGGFLVADPSGNRLRRVGRDGTVTLVAGTGQKGSAGDGGPARDAQLDDPEGVAVRGDGSIFVLSKEAGLLRRIRRDGRIETFAGLPSACEGAHGQYATGVRLSPTAVAATPDAGLLLSDSDQDGCVLRVSADGRVHVAARGFAAGSLVPMPDGGFLAAAWDAVWRVERDGAATIVAGCEVRPCAAGDGPARSADLEGAQALAAEPGGGFVLAEPQRVARVDGSGMLTTIAHVGGPSLARGADGGLLLAHPEAGGGAPAGSVVRIGLDGAVAVVAGGGSAVPRAGLLARAVTLQPVQVQGLPDGFAVLDGDRRIVMVGAGGTVTRVVPAAGASAFAMLPDGGVVAVRRSQRDDASRAQRLLPNGAWTTLAGGPLAPARGVPASSVQVGAEGFALMAGGRVMVQQDDDHQIWVGRDGRVERTTRLRLGIEPVVSGPGGSALFDADGEVRRVAADRSIVTVAGNEANAGENGGFFGSTDGQPARFAELSGELALASAGRDGGVLIGQDAMLAEADARIGRVLWVAPPRTRRLGVAITRRSLRLLQHREIAIRTTVPARVELLIRRGRRVAGRSQARIEAGETPVALPRRVTDGGEVVVVVRASARDGQRAWTSHRFLLGSRLPTSTARRIVAGRACRRYTGRRVVCVTQETIEGSNLIVERCVAVALLLEPDGVVYANGFDNEEGRCDRRRVARLLKSRPVWSAETEAPPLSP